MVGVVAGRWSMALDCRERGTNKHSSDGVDSAAVYTYVHYWCVYIRTLLECIHAYIIGVYAYVHCWSVYIRTLLKQTFLFQIFVVFLYRRWQLRCSTQHIVRTRSPPLIF